MIKISKNKLGRIQADEVQFVTWVISWAAAEVQAHGFTLMCKIVAEILKTEKRGGEKRSIPRLWYITSLWSLQFYSISGSCRSTHHLLGLHWWSPVTGPHEFNFQTHLSTSLSLGLYHRAKFHEGKSTIFTWHSSLAYDSSLFVLHLIDWTFDSKTWREWRKFAAVYMSWIRYEHPSFTNLFVETGM